MRRFIILKILPLQVLSIKIETPFAFDKAFLSESLIIVGIPRRGLGYEYLQTTDKLNSGLNSYSSPSGRLWKNTSNDAPIRENL